MKKTYRHNSVYRQTSAVFCGLLTILLAAMTYAEKSERLVQTAVYSGKYEAFEVKMERQLLDLGGGKFLLKASAKNFFASITESESFYWRDAQIIPIEYRYKQKIFGVKRERSTKFDWQSKSANFMDGDGNQTVSLSAGILGPMTYQLRMQIDVIEGKEKLDYQFIKRGKIKEYLFNRVESETLDRKNIGKALLVRRTDDGGDKQTDVWFDIDRDFALVAIQHTDDGDTNSMYLEKIEKFPPLDNTPYSALIKRSAKAKEKAEQGL